MIVFKIGYLHSGQKCLPWVACLSSKMPMFQREGATPTSISVFDSYDMKTLVISSLASKCKDFELRGLQFHFIKQLENGHPNFKDLPF